MIFISDSISLEDSEVEINAIRSQGGGGLTVNKVSSAIQLRSHINASSLSSMDKQLLLESKDSRISNGSGLIITPQQFRTQEKNKIGPFARVRQFIIAAT